MINSIQVSETTRDILVSVRDDDDVILEERGVVKIKGKGMMQTYLLRSSEENGT